MFRRKVIGYGSMHFRVSVWSLCCLITYFSPIMFVLQANAQGYPTKPIRLVCPFPPGGTTDLVARIVAQRLNEAWGQQVIVDNRPGAGSLVGIQIVAKAAPNGYTILVAGSALTVYAATPATHKKLDFDPLNDLYPVSFVISSPQLLAVSRSVVSKSLQELIALAKARPGQLNYASPGAGTPQHLTFELFKSIAAIDAVHVPYKGTGPAITDLIGGQVQMMITGVVALMPHLKSGKLRAIAVTSAKRVAALPDIPTFSESGIANFDMSSWLGVFLPAGTPQPIVSTLNGEIRKIVEAPEVRKQLIDQGADPASNTPAQFAAYLKSETATWARVFRDTDIRAD